MDHMISVMVTAAILYIEYASCREMCAPSSNVPKYEEMLTKLDSEDVIVEAKYINNYRFTVTHSWNVNNGNLDYGDSVFIDIDALTESLRKCFEDVVQSEKYFLLLRKQGDSAKSTTKLSPLPIKKRSTRERLWNKICLLPSIECRMTLSRKLLPAVIQLFPSMNNLLRCGVKSRSRITEIRWFKDGKDIEEEGGNFYAKNGLIVRSANLKSGKSDLIIYDAHSMHSGLYSCTARNTEGETASISTRLTVGSLSDAFIDCPSFASEYCQNGARCMGVRGLPGEIVCECKSGFQGSRCHETSLPEMGEVKVEQELSKQVSELKTVLIAVSCCFAVCLLCLIILAYLRLKSGKTLSSKDKSSDSFESTNKIQLEANSTKIKHESVSFLQQTNSPGRVHRQRLSGFHESQINDHGKNSFEV